MITSLTFTNLAGGTIEFNTDILPLRVFETSTDIRKSERERPEQHGIWPAFTYLGRGTIHLEGDILYNDSTSYIAARMALLRTLFEGMTFNPTAPVSTNRKMGDLTVQYVGFSEAFTTPDGVTIDGYPEIPMHALYPGTTPFMLTFISFTPYYLGVSTGTLYPI